MKETRDKRLEDAVWSRLFKMPRKGKSIGQKQHSGCLGLRVKVNWTPKEHKDFIEVTQMV